MEDAIRKMSSEAQDVYVLARNSAIARGHEEGEASDLAEQAAALVGHELTPDNVTPLLADVAKFDPNQPREPKGSPVGGRWRGFHGTSDRALKSILEHGLLETPPQRNYELGYYDSPKYPTRGKSVFMTQEINAAIAYALNSDSHAPIILEVEVPDEFVDVIRRDELDSRSVRFVGRIPPAWIKAVRRIDGDPFDVPDLRDPLSWDRTELNKMSRIYVVVDLEAYAEEHGIEKYDPNQPRVPAGTAEGGRWTDGDISGREKLEPTPEKVPEHIRKLRIPPAWQDVLVNLDPDGDLLAIGRDAKGRLQYVYSEKFVESQMRAKFARIAELEDKHADIWDQLDFGDDRGLVTALIMDTGIRPGSTRDRGGDKQAFGATTLLGQHVTQDADRTVRLRFPGKHGIPLSVPISNAVLADTMMKRAQSVGSDGRLFSVTDNSLRDYVDGLDGGSFTPKDFRTYVGTSTARQLVDEITPPKSFTEYKRAVRTVAKQVAEQLGNTPTVALQSYIDPSVFSSWRVGVSAAKSDIDLHFGVVGKDEDFDWRKIPIIDPDDDELDMTSPDVLAVLGFDPKEN